METTVEVRDDLPPPDFEKFLRWVEEVKKEIPEEHWPNATVVIGASGYDDYSYATCVVSYEREETPEEKRQREATERITKLHAEQRERQRYEELRKKFEPASAKK